MITYVGGYLSNRGLDTTLRAMPKVVAEIPETLLVLVGDGAARRDLEELSSELGLESHVRFEGWVDFGRIPGYLAASDVCILPLSGASRRRGAVPQVVPVHAHGQAGGRQRVRRDEPRHPGPDCGLLFPPGDSEALSDALIRLKDPALRSRLGEHGREGCSTGTTGLARGETAPRL